MSEKFNGEQVDDTDDAVYETQRDNKIDPGVTCAATTLSMMIQSADLKNGETRKGKEIEDLILADLKVKYPNGHKALREDFNFLAKYAKDKYGLSLKYAGMNKNDWIAKILNSDRPFMTSTSNALTKFGHIILSRGIKTTADGLMLRFNDPYGEWPYKTNKSGENVLYAAMLFPFDDGQGNQKTYHTLSYA